MDLKLCEFYDMFFKKILKGDPKTLEKFQSFLMRKQDVVCNQEERNDSYKNDSVEIEKLAYIYQHNLCTSSAVAFLFKELLEKNISLLRKFLKQSAVNICCFSDGSCAEIVSLLEVLFNESETTVNYFFTNVTVVCPVESWTSTSKKIFQHLENYFPLSLKKKFEFIAVDLAEELPSKVVEAIESADILSMVKFLSSIKICDRQFHEIYQDILRYVSPGSVVFFLDHAYRNLLRPINRYLFTYELLHYKVNYLHTLHLKAVEKIFRLYQVHFKNSLCLSYMQISFGAWLNVNDFILPRKLFNSIGDKHLIVKTDKVNRRADNEINFYDGLKEAERNKIKISSSPPTKYFRTEDTLIYKKKYRAKGKIYCDRILYCIEYAEKITDFLKISGLNVNNFMPPTVRFSEEKCRCGKKCGEILSMLKAAVTEEDYLSNLKSFLLVSGEQLSRKKLGFLFTINHQEFRLRRQNYWLSRVEHYEQQPSGEKELAELITEGEGLVVLKEITETILNQERLKNRLVQCVLDKYEVHYINLFVEKVSAFLDESSLDHEFVLPLFFDYVSVFEHFAINQKCFLNGEYHETLDFFRSFLSTEAKPFPRDKIGYTFTESHNEVRLLCEKMWLAKVIKFQKECPMHKFKRNCAISPLSHYTWEYHMVKLIARGKGLAVLKAFVECFSFFDIRLKLIEGRKRSLKINLSERNSTSHSKYSSDVSKFVELFERKDFWLVSFKMNIGQRLDAASKMQKVNEQNVIKFPKKMTKKEKKQMQKVNGANQNVIQIPKEMAKKEKKLMQKVNGDNQIVIQVPKKEKKQLQKVNGANQNVIQVPKEMTKKEKKQMQKVNGAHQNAIQVPKEMTKKEKNQMQKVNEDNQNVIQIPKEMTKKEKKQMQKVNEANQNVIQIPKEMTKKEKNRLERIQQDEELKARRKEKERRKELVRARMEEGRRKELIRAQMEEERRQRERLQHFEQKFSEKMEQAKIFAAEKKKKYTTSLDELLKQLSETKAVESEMDFDTINYERDYEIPSFSCMHNSDYSVPCAFALNQNKSKNKRWTRKFGYDPVASRLYRHVSSEPPRKTQE